MTRATFYALTIVVLLVSVWLTIHDQSLAADVGSAPQPQPGAPE